MASSSNPVSMQEVHNLLSTPNVEKALNREAGLEPSTVPQETSKTPKRCDTVEVTEERPEWLPEGWTMNVRERTSRKWKGVRDRYYYDPKNLHCFRSKKAVLRFLNTGIIPNNKRRSKAVESATNNPQSALRFDFKNPPAKVSWALTNSAEGSWTPYINGEEVSESTRNSWVNIMEGICSNAYQFQCFGPRFHEQE